jgi:hypothetical protein
MIFAAGNTRFERLNTGSPGKQDPYLEGLRVTVSKNRTIGWIRYSNKGSRFMFIPQDREDLFIDSRVLIKVAEKLAKMNGENSGKRKQIFDHLRHK